MISYMHYWFSDAMISPDLFFFFFFARFSFLLVEAVNNFSGDACYKGFDYGFFVSCICH